MAEGHVDLSPGNLGIQSGRSSNLQLKDIIGYKRLHWGPRRQMTLSASELGNRATFWSTREKISMPRKRGTQPPSGEVICILGVNISFLRECQLHKNCHIHCCQRKGFPLILLSGFRSQKGRQPCVCHRLSVSFFRMLKTWSQAA